MPPLKPTRGILLNKSHPLARDLVGLWLFNEGTGKKVFDLSGNGNTPTFGGTPVWTAGSLEFDGNGTGDSLILPDDGFSYDDLTIIMRVKPTIAQSTYTQLFSMTNNADTDRFLCGINSIDGGGVARLYDDINDRGVVACTSTKTWSLGDNPWSIIAFVIGKNGGRKIYIDSVLDGSEAFYTTGPADVGVEANCVKISGYQNIGVVAEEIDGLLDWCYIYNRALSSSEIALLYREPFCMFERAWIPKLIGGQIINLAGTSAALSSLNATAKTIRKVGGTVASTSDVAALLNLIRGEETSLEIERSWLREALFNGMSANALKLGTTLSLGWFWVRVSGCSVLYRGPSMERIDFTNILTVAEQDACEISPPSYIPHNSSSTYFYVIRRFNNCGYQELTLAAAAKVSIDASGELEKPQPNNILGSKAEQVDGNKIQLVWFYCPLEQKSQPVCFNVYYDGGMGQIDYENPLAKIGYEGQRFYSYQSGALDAGGYLFTIRAEDVDGIENSSPAQLRIQLDTTNPDAIDILSTETA